MPPPRMQGCITRGCRQYTISYLDRVSGYMTYRPASSSPPHNFPHTMRPVAVASSTSSHPSEGMHNNEPPAAP